MSGSNANYDITIPYKSKRLIVPTPNYFLRLDKLKKYKYTKTYSATVT